MINAYNMYIYIIYIYKQLCPEFQIISVYIYVFWFSSYSVMNQYDTGNTKKIHSLMLRNLAQNYK